MWEVTLSPYRNYHSVKDVVEGLVSEFGVHTVPPLSVYGQVHMESLSTCKPNFSDDPKVNYFTCNLVKACLAKHPSLPYTYHQMVEYVNAGTTEISEYDGLDFLWNFRQGGTQYSFTMYARAAYYIAKALALMLGFLEFDPNRLGHTHIPAHNTVHFPVGNNKYLYNYLSDE